MLAEGITFTYVDSAVCIDVGRHRSQAFPNLGHGPVTERPKWLSP